MTLHKDKNGKLFPRYVQQDTTVYKYIYSNI